MVTMCKGEFLWYISQRIYIFIMIKSSVIHKDLFIMRKK